MKPIYLIAASAMALAFAASAASAAEVEIEHAVARVVVIPEDRTDIAVEIEQGGSDLPALRVERRGDDVHIDGGLGRRIAGIGMGSGVNDCRPGPQNASQPGEGASVDVRNIGRVNLSDAPLIVLRTPRGVDVSVGGAVFGSVGRGASSIELANAGCGAWTVANTDGELSISAAGSGPIRAGMSGSLDLALAGSGDVTAGATRRAEVSVAGSGDVVIASVDGNLEVSIAGSGDVAVRRGRSPSVDISIAGSGGVDFGGQAVDVDVSIVGSGDVRVASATGAVSRSIMGSGDVRIGQ